MRHVKRDLLLSLVFAGAALQGCNTPNNLNASNLTTTNPSGSASPSPTPTAPTSPTPIPIPGPGVYDARKGFALEIVPNPSYTYYLHETGSATTPNPAAPLPVASPCAIPSLSPTASNNDIYCKMETNELDLWYNGVTFNYNVPFPMCTYVMVYPYWHYTYQPGAFTTATLGLWKTTDMTSGSTVMTYKVSQNGGAYAMVTAGAAGSFFDVGGTPLCTYDYSRPQLGPAGPNCCLGTYTYTVTNVGLSSTNVTVVVPSPSPSPTVSPSPVAISSTTTSFENWGGVPGNCAAGAAMDTQAKGVNGLPSSSTLPVPSTGMNNSLTFKSPASKGLQNNYSIANFYDPGATYYNIAAANGSCTPGTNCPQALNPPVNVAPVAPPNPQSGLVPQAYYEFQCLDSSATTLARIRVQIRKWNLSTELTKYVANPANGDPHLSATVDPITGLYVDNYHGWDSPAINPGPASGFPGLSE